MRGALDYTAHRDAPPDFRGLDPSTPVEGFYRARRRKGAAPSAIRIWYGPPSDPVTGEVLDRSWRWQATVNGQWVEWESVWPHCGRDPIDQATHDRLVREFATRDEFSPFYDHHRSVDLLTATPPTF